MPPSAKRTRTKRDLASNGIDDVDSPTASPAQSVKRRRTKEREPAEPEHSDPVLPATQVELNMNDEEIISTVASHLTMPPHFVQVQKDHNNSLHQAQSKNVAAYAKVTGKDWTFYVKRLSTSIGRPPEAYYPPAGDEAPTTPLASNEGVDVPAAPTESSRIHIDLGPNKLVSRLHAEIYFDSNTSAWYVLVNGRNGLKIDELIVRRGQKSKLRSGAVIEIGGVEMMFVLPAGDQPVEIHEKYLRRAGLIAPDPFADNANDTMGLEGRDLHRALGKMNQLRALSGQPVLAPAPPDYIKPDTPIKQRSKPMSTQSPALNNSGITMMSSGEVDLSLEQNNHIKPTYTYGQLITQAIMACPNELATLNDIYKFLQKNYSFYRKPELQKGWQNSIRHNLSLNPGFRVKQRGPDDTGKGGYWGFVPENRDNMVADAFGGKASRKSPRRRDGSTTPNSPGQKNGRTVHGPGDKDGGSPSRKLKRSPRSRSPALNAFPPKGPQFTPDRGMQLPKVNDGLPGDGSPLPRHRRTANNVFGLSDNVVGSPVLSSSFAPEDGSALLTPAPVRKHPHLAPPSTAQRPSQHMPTSSPAPFWRYAELGNTPLRGSFDMSPLKDLGGAGSIPQSSSPPPRRGSAGSPSRNSGEIKREMPEVEDGIDEEPAFDLTRGFMKISNYHAKATNGGPISGANQGPA